MQTSSGWFRAAALLTLAAATYLCLPLRCWAVDTHVWEQSEQAEFASGTPKNLSLRSDGHITLAPHFTELDSTGVPYLWAIAQNSKGTLYFAGGAPTGATAKVFELAPGGKPRQLAELTGLEVHALAVDAEDRVYAAVLPDAKIYRIDGGGKPQLFFDPKCKYIWSMVFDRQGNLYVATGDAGLIYRVTPDGKGAKFFDTEETHARSMILDDAGNLIVGTEPGGLILRITPKGESFVLYQAGKREVTAVAEKSGIIYASAVGNKVTVTGAPPVLPAKTPAVTPSGTAQSGNAPPSLPPAIGSLSAAVSGGSEIDRIQKDGFAERIWSSPTDLVYALAFDSNGKPLAGTGNKGVIYRIDSDQLSTELLNTPPTQVTALLAGKGGMVYAATGNVGNLYSLAPALEASGTLQSDVLDTHDFAYWGKVHTTASLDGGSIKVETRSGNLNNPENNWSAWTEVPVNPLGGQIQSPPARFLQYRLTLERAPGGASPEVSVVDLAYLPKNIAPKVGPIEMAPMNYREPPSTSALERSVTASGSPLTLTLSAVGQRRSNLSTAALESSGGGATLQYSKGFVTARWNATDANNDPLIYKVELRGKNSQVWRTLKDKLQDRFYAFDGAAFPDGEYVLRITASDSPGNTPASALESSLESDSFTIDNTPPAITDVNVQGSQYSFTAQDALTWIDKAEYSVDGGDWIQLTPVNKVTDSQVLHYAFSARAAQTVAVRVFDENDNVVVKQLASER